MNNYNHSYGFSKSSIARSFNAAAATYTDAAILQGIVADRLLERLDLVNIRPELILDLGAATGLCTTQLQRRYKNSRVLGLDLAWRMSAVANRQRQWLSKQRYVCADAEFLPLRDNSVALVFSNLMLQWMNQPDRLFAEVQRVLVPGGLFMFTSFGPDTLKEMRQSWSQVDDRIHVNRFMDMHDVGDSLTRNGFEGAVMDNETIIMNYGSVTDLHQDLRALGETNINHGRNPCLTGKSSWQCYLQAYQQFLTQDGDVPASWEIVYGHAWSTKQNLPDNSKFTGSSANINIKSL